MVEYARTAFISFLVIAIILSSCEERELVSPKDTRKTGNTNYLQSTYDYRQEGSPVLQELGISDDSNKNVSFNSGSGSQSSATDKDDETNDDTDNNGSGDDDVITEEENFKRTMLQ